MFFLGVLSLFIITLSLVLKLDRMAEASEMIDAGELIITVIIVLGMTSIPVIFIVKTLCRM